MKKTIYSNCLRTALLTALLIAPVAILPADAQDSKIFQRREIVEMEDDDDNLTYEIFAMDLEDGSQYFLDLGNPGFGDEIIQVQLDPVFRLYVKLGDSLDEAIATMESFIAQIKDKPGTETQVTGYINLAVPDEKNAETVTVKTRKPLLSRYLEFSVQREGYIRAADIHRSDLKGLLFSLKAHRKLHPKEK